VRAAHPALTTAQVRQALEQSAVDLGAAGRDDEFGDGLIDPVAALAVATSLDTGAPQPPAPPTGLTATAGVQQVALAYLADGDLDGAHGVLRTTVERGVPAPRLAAQMAGFLELGWALETPAQELVLRLNPSAFDNDRAWWAQTLATLRWQRGDTAGARAYADSAIAPTRQQVVGASTDPQLRGLLALQLAYQGRTAEARAEEQRSLAHLDRFSLQAYNYVNAAKTELALGDRAAAVSLLRKARERGYFVTNGFLRLDPTYASLKGFPAFEQMLEGK